MSLQTLSDADRELLDDSPTLARLVRKGRLAPSRLAQLLAAARTTAPPKEPEPWECCGSNCRPCVLELWKEEVRVWNECHPDGVSDDDSVEDSSEEKAGEEERQEERKDELRVAKVDEEEDGHRSSSWRETPRVEIELEKLDLSSADEAEVDG